MKVTVKLAFRNYVVGQELPDVPDSLAEDWIRRGLVEQSAVKKTATADSAPQKPIKKR